MARSSATWSNVASSTCSPTYREAATVTAWLACEGPSIGVIARDRGAAYVQAATDGRPNAIQVADRWHLMENASAAFLTAVQHPMQGAPCCCG